VRAAFAPLCGVDQASVDPYGGAADEYRGQDGAALPEIMAGRPSVSGFPSQGKSPVIRGSFCALPVFCRRGSWVSSEVPHVYAERVIVREQVRAARGMLGWSQHRLAEAAALPLSAVKAIEAGKDVRVSIVSAIEKALADAGILFLESGDTRDGGRGLRFRQP